MISDRLGDPASLFESSECHFEVERVGGEVATTKQPLCAKLGGRVVRCLECPREASLSRLEKAT